MILSNWEIPQNDNFNVEMDGETVKHDTILERTKRHPQVPRLGGSWSNMISRVRLTNPFAFRCQN
jgi:hypothetical protein